MTHTYTQTTMEIGIIENLMWLNLKKKKKNNLLCEPMATNTRLIRYYICYKVARYFFTFFCVCFRIKMVHVLLLKQCLKRQDRFALEPDIKTLWVFVFCNKGRKSARTFF